MKIEGTLKKVGKWYAVEIPMLLIHTQGATRKEALEMAKDAVETVVDSQGFEASVLEITDAKFLIGGNDDSLFAAAILRQQRGAKGLSVRDVAAALGSSSPNSYGRYESGDTKLTLQKFSQFLSVILDDQEAVLSLERRRA